MGCCQIHQCCNLYHNPWLQLLQRIWRFWKRNHRKFLTVRSLPTLSSRLENTLLHHLPGSKKNVNFWYWLALLLALTFLDFRFTIPPTVDKMSSNKFDALGSDDSEGEGDPGQTLVEVDWPKKISLTQLRRSSLRRERSHLYPSPRASTGYSPSIVCGTGELLLLLLVLGNIWLFLSCSRRGPGKQSHNFDQNLKLLGRWAGLVALVELGTRNLVQVCHLWAVLGDLQPHGQAWRTCQPQRLPSL